MYPMAQDTYTLAWILPYVRQALRQTSNFEFRTYANALFAQLEQAQVPGIARFQLGDSGTGEVTTIGSTLRLKTRQ